MEKILVFHNRLATIIGLLIMVIVLVIVADAGGRFLLNKPVPGAVEISKVILAWILFLSLAYGLIRGAHVRMEVLLIRYSPRVLLVFETFTAVLSIAFFGLMTYAGWIQFWDSFSVGQTMAAPIWIPFWLAKLAVPVGTLLLAAQFGISAAMRIAGAKKGQATALTEVGSQA